MNDIEINNKETMMRAYIPPDWEMAHSIAQVYSKLPDLSQDLVGNVPAILARFELGAQLGLSPIASLRAFYSIPGDPSRGRPPQTGLYTKVALALVMNHPEYAGHTIEKMYKDGQFIGCKGKIARIVRGKELEYEQMYTIKDAETAGLTGKNNWRSNPGPAMMCEVRVLSRLCNWMFPDAIAGLAVGANDADDDEAGEKDVTPPDAPAAAPDIVDSAVAAKPKTQAEKLKEKIGLQGNTKAPAPIEVAAVVEPEPPSSAPPAAPDIPKQSLEVYMEMMVASESDDQMLLHLRNAISEHPGMAEENIRRAVDMAKTKDALLAIKKICIGEFKGKDSKKKNFESHVENRIGEIDAIK